MSHEDAELVSRHELERRFLVLRLALPLALALVCRGQS